MKRIITLMVVFTFALYSCATVTPDSDESPLEQDLREQEIPVLSNELKQVITGFLETIGPENFTITDDGKFVIESSQSDKTAELLSKISEDATNVQVSSELGKVHLRFHQIVGDQNFVYDGVWAFHSSGLWELDSNRLIWELDFKSQIPVTDTGNIHGYVPDLPADISGQFFFQGQEEPVHSFFADDIVMDQRPWQEITIPMIIPEVYRSTTLSGLPYPLQKNEKTLVFFLPHMYGYDVLNSEEINRASLRLLQPGDSGVLQGYLRTPGALHFRTIDFQGFYLQSPEPSSWYFIDGNRASESGYGTSLPLKAQILKETLISSVDVLGADSYELLSGGNRLFESDSDQILRSESPVFNHPGYESVVFSALRGGRVLFEVVYEFSLFNQLPELVELDLPGFRGRVMSFPLTNSQAIPLVEHLLAQGHVQIQNTLGMVEIIDGFNRTQILGLGDLDYGNQFGILYENELLMIRENRAEHPIIGVSWIGAGRLAWVLGILYGQETKLLPPRISGYFNEDEYRWRLPTSEEWEAFAETRTGFRPTRETANYYRSFDLFEDPNPPHTRVGGPTNPRFTFPPDSVYGLYGTRGNVWEWTQDLVPGSEIPEIATGPLDGQRIYRRVMGGAWNSPLSAFGPRGLEIPKGWFAEDQTSWSIGLRFVLPGL